MKYIVFLGTILGAFCVSNAEQTNLKVSHRMYFSTTYDTITEATSPCILYKDKKLVTSDFKIPPDHALIDQSLISLSSLAEDTLDSRSENKYYTASLVAGKISGKTVLSSTRSGEILAMSFSWEIFGDITDNAGTEILTYITKKYLPCLPRNMTIEGVHKLVYKKFTETFSLIRLSDSDDPKHGPVPHWSLNYRVSRRGRNDL